MGQHLVSAVEIGSQNTEASIVIVFSCVAEAGKLKKKNKAKQKPKFPKFSCNLGSTNSVQSELLWKDRLGARAIHIVGEN